MRNILSIALAAFATSAFAAPAPDKRQQGSAIGYASLNGGTKGVAGGTTTTVSTYAQFTAATKISGPKVIYISGTISGSEKVRATNDTSIIGLNSNSGWTGFGLYIRRVKNVIVQNVKVTKSPADAGDAIGVDDSTNVWVDHVDLSSALVSDKDFYDGLFDVSHGSDYITLSNSYLHDHWKASLVGDSDNNADEDRGHLTVTYANNIWRNVGSRTALVRFGSVHLYNQYYENVSISGVNTRMGAKVLVESTQFVNTVAAITSRDSDEKGTAQVNDVDLGGSTNDAPVGSGYKPPYSYSVVGSKNVKSALTGKVGNTLRF